MRMTTRAFAFLETKKFIFTNKNQNPHFLFLTKAMLDALNFLRISRFHFQLLVLNHYRRHHHDHHDHHNHCNHRHHRQSHCNCDRQVLFRPCAMCVPDLRLICEIMLVSEAFMEVWIGRLDQIISMTRQSRCPGSSSPSTPCARNFSPSRYHHD